MNEEVLSQEREEKEIGSEQIDERDNTIASLRSELEQSKDQLLRRTAEMDNMRRRHQQERVQLIYEANKRLIAELLGSVDDLERIISHLKPEDMNVLSEGIELVCKNFLKTLEQNSVKPMEVIGKTFDVHLHDAMLEVERNDLEPGTITAEVQKGYMMGEAVLRHAKVIVTKRSEGN